MSTTQLRTPPAGYQLILTKHEWDSVNRLAPALGLEVVLGINAGPGPRDATGHWLSGNALQLLRYTAGRRYPLPAVEFGNEPNLFALSGMPPSYTAGDYVRDHPGVQHGSKEDRPERAADRARQLLQQHRKRDAIRHWAG